MEFGLLGPLVVRRGGADVPVPRGKQRVLLAVLLLNAGHVVPVSALAEALWGPQPPPSAEASIQNYVKRLRQVLGDTSRERICTRPPGYLIRVADDELDVLRFEALLDAARAAARAGGTLSACDLYQRALALWRDEPFADVDALSGHPAVIGLADERIDVTLEYASLVSSTGMYAKALPHLKALTVSRPLDERLHAALMIALAGGGQQAEALHLYDGLRQRLDEELGVLPGMELRAAHEKVLRQEIQPEESNADWGEVHQLPVASVPAQLPADIGDFTGRGTQVRHLCEMLARDDTASSPGTVPIAVVAGAAGVGKTALAVHAAHQVRAAFPDGQLYADLHGATAQPAAPGDVLARFLRDLGVDGTKVPVADEERAALYRTRITGRRMLIVLDNARDAAQVRPLLPGTACCTVLVTVRNRMPDLASTQIFDLNVLTDTEALALFSRIVGDDRPSAEPDATVEVLDVCAGLPLAIRICAARLAARSRWKIATMANRLRNEQWRLDELKVGDLEVRASFQVSYASLRAPEDGVDPAKAFRLLGLWQGSSINLSAAAALLGEPEADVADALEMLVDANLLESPAPDWYRFHDLLRVYAGERVAAEESQESQVTALHRLYLWYLHTMDAAAHTISPNQTQQPLTPRPESRPLSFADRDTALDWCEAERENLVTATRQAAADNVDDVAWQLPAAAMTFYNRRGYRSDWITTHQFALDTVRRLQMRWGEALTLNNLGMAYQDLKMETAVAYLEQALAIRREIGDPKGEAQTANNLLDTYLRWKRFAEVVEARQETLVKQQQARNPYGEAIALNNVGEAYLGLGNVDYAIDCLSEARKIFRDLGDAHGEAFTMMNLGVAYLELKQPDQGLDYLRQAVAIHHAARERRGEATALKRLGDAYINSGYPMEAREPLTRACAIFEDLRDKAQAADIRLKLQAQIPRP